ncbi:hypothetical protein FA13DRAFT_743768 [Coprinellus micaceus]|uniref:Uncharacterized protein n=1 Tax=Coprinellus micaceus TaxID=71717 RepID=A0A4Y7TW40_COPMI|nr:hypothetical protein FA13DRAFT_743768 [Coprinellus micaceus]
MYRALCVASSESKRGLYLFFSRTMSQARAKVISSLEPTDRLNFLAHFLQNPANAGRTMHQDSMQNALTAPPADSSNPHPSARPSKKPRRLCPIRKLCARCSSLHHICLSRLPSMCLTVNEGREMMLAKHEWRAELGRVVDKPERESVERRRMQKEAGGDRSCWAFRERTLHFAEGAGGIVWWLSGSGRNTDT